ncbi:MAG: glycine reductase [Oscillospiraceae bacterium]|nr:glycine reductase [Oscillospiraceae bacterium]
MSNLQKTIAAAFLEMAEGLESGSFGKKPKIALTGMGSEHGEENAMKAALMAAKRGVDVYYIGTLEAEGVTTVHVENEDEGHKKMDELVESGAVDGAVTMHYPFPIGVSTVGRVITPAKGKEMFVANTTGTSSGDRIEGMIKNAVYGIITAKASGVKNPTVGILNVDGARQCEIALNQLKDGGYEFEWATSGRADGGAVMRGNDVLQGSPDVMVMDSLTGNVLIKMLSAYTTGGSFEATGYGYGPGIGMDYNKLILIISRASGAPLIANALEFAAQLVRGKVFDVAKEEFAKAEKAGFSKILEARKAASKPAAAEEEVKAPPAEPCPAAILGVEVMDLEDAVKVLWKAGIYAESGMGCTGPVVLMSDANHDKAVELLRAAGYIG